MRILSSFQFLDLSRIQRHAIVLQCLLHPVCHPLKASRVLTEGRIDPCLDHRVAHVSSALLAPGAQKFRSSPGRASSTRDGE
jgi:hypothetical protein